MLRLYCMYFFTSLALASSEIAMLQNCGGTISVNPADTPHGIISVEDSGFEENSCVLTIKSSSDYVISMKLTEVNFPSCSQSELSVISILGPDDVDHYPVFNSYPHFCGQKFSPDVILEQNGENEWQLHLKTKPEKVYSKARLAYSVHKPDDIPVWSTEKGAEPTSVETPVNTDATVQITSSTSGSTSAVIRDEETTTVSMKEPQPTTATTPFLVTTVQETENMTSSTTGAPLDNTASSPERESTTLTFSSKANSGHLNASSSAVATSTLTKLTSTEKPQTRKSTTILTTVTALPIFQCSCVVTLSATKSEPVIGGPVYSPPRTYQISALRKGQTCYDPKTIKSCNDKCISISQQQYLTLYGPRKIVQASSDATSLASIYLGDAVCRNAWKNYTSVKLTLNSHVLSCPGVTLSKVPVSVIDDNFSCYNKRFCSEKFHRATVDNLRCPYSLGRTTSTASTTTKRTTFKTTPTPPFRCSCVLGVHQELFGLFHQKNITKFIPTITLQGKQCGLAISECKTYCTSRGSSGAFLSTHVDYYNGMWRSVSDLPCDGTKTQLSQQNKLYIYGQLSAASSCADFWFKEKNQMFQAHLLLNSFCCSKVHHGGDCSKAAVIG